jgi:hypothetical protein
MCFSDTLLTVSPFSESSAIESRKIIMASLARAEALSEAMIDATLADSFPASDPPAWTLGRDCYRTEPSKINEKEKRVIDEVAE